jgi:hypothetical protein
MAKKRTQKSKSEKNVEQATTQGTSAKLAKAALTSRNSKASGTKGGSASGG